MMVCEGKRRSYMFEREREREREKEKETRMSCYTPQVPGGNAMLKTEVQMAEREREREMKPRTVLQYMSLS